MKSLKIVPFIVLVLIATSCKNKQKAAVTMDVIVEDHVSDQYEFPQGTYYEYVFENTRDYEFNEVELLKKVKDAGFSIRNAWYKPGSSSCTPPGSEYGMNVIVEPKLLVQLNAEDDRISNFGFTKATRIYMGGCAYRVKHYVIHK